MTERALSFGSVAAAYEQFRLGYPDAVVDAVLEYADGRVLTALEIGAGTGKATRVFAQRGIAVTATDPDPEMLAELRRHVPAAATLECTLEQVPTDDVHDLVYAAASLHWTAAEGRWDRVAALLREGGTFASFGGPMHLEDAAVDEEVDALLERLGADAHVPAPDGTPEDSEMDWPGTELVESPLFADVRQVEVPRRLPLSAGHYVGYLSTVSALLTLPPPTRAEVLEQVRSLLPTTIGVRADLTLHLARRV